MDYSDEDDMDEVDMSLPKRYFARLMSILPRGVESTERGIAYLKEHTAKLDAELAGHMAALNFAEERYIRETARHQAKCDYRIAQSSAAHAAGTLDTLYFGADGEARHRQVPGANTTTTRPDPIKATRYQRPHARVQSVFCIWGKTMI